MTKRRLGFGDLDPILKVTAELKLPNFYFLIVCLSVQFELGELIWLKMGQT